MRESRLRGTATLPADPRVVNPQAMLTSQVSNILMEAEDNHRGEVI